MGKGKKYEPKPPAKSKFKKGQSGNPSGRPPRSAFIHGFLDEVVALKGQKVPASRRLLQIEALWTAAANHLHKDFIKANELLLSYDFGKPAQRVEMSGPGGGPIESADKTPPRRRTTGELRKRRDELIRKIEAHKAEQAAAAAAPEAESPKTDDGDQGGGDP